MGQGVPGGHTPWPLKASLTCSTTSRAGCPGAGLLMPLIQVHSQVALVLHSAVEAFGPFAFDPLRSSPSEQVLKSLGNPDNRPVHGWITAHC